MSVSNDVEMGTLYGVGVGPGDPKLLTLRALEIMARVPVIFAASSPKNNYSRALAVVEGTLSSRKEVHKLPFPMTSDQEVLEKSWKENAELVLEVLRQGRDAAFLTIGDSLTYSTYGYLIQTLGALEPDLKTESIPGITAYHAAAARMNLPLVESKESLLVLSGVSDPELIPRLAELADNLVIMKAYRNYDQIMDALESLPDGARACTVSNCCQPGEALHPDAFALRGQKMPYLSLIIAKNARGRERT
jgi:precorrin-2/cobalt-factor-2 C20-methyltransferase